jgi:hypothetical protein
MSTTALADAAEEYGDLLEEAIEATRKGSGLAMRHFNVELSHRILAIHALLADADVDLFLDRLERSGTARLELMKTAARGTPCDPQTLIATKAMGFPAALAAGNFELATAIAQVMPDQHAATWEYEDDFLFIDLMRQLVLGLDAGGTGWVKPAKAALARWKVVRKGRPSPEQDVCRALVERDQNSFTAAFPELVEARRGDYAAYRKGTSYDPKIFATEGHVWIEGFALLELATRLGLASEPEYPLLPSLARSARSPRRGPSPDWLRS